MKPRFVTTSLSALAIFGSLVWTYAPRAGGAGDAGNERRIDAPAGRAVNPNDAVGSGRAIEESVGSRFVGSLSCAASNCHGGGRHGAAGERQYVCDEYGRWLQFDRHALAFETLRNEASRKIAGKLGLIDAEGNSTAHSSTECLGCHATGATRPPADGAVLSHAEGVSCEDCHGAAWDWLKPHQRTDWSMRSLDDKQELGFVDTKNHAARGRVCAGCHVGGVGRDVNHDLIAAGHPRLLFELASYQELMVPHWDLAKERARTPQLEARLWAVGQLTTAVAALRLLEQRARNATPPEGLDAAVHRPAPWPEFSEYACGACHHNLRHPSDRGDRGPLFRPGDQVWGAWTFALRSDRAALDLPNTAVDSLFDERLAVLVSSPRVKPADVLPRVETLADQLKKDADDLAKRFVDEPPADADVRRWFDRLADARISRDVREWDSLAQHYLALTSVARSLFLADDEFDSVPRTPIAKSLDEFRVLLLRPYYSADLPQDAGP